jgi:hypothetical protein
MSDYTLSIGSISSLWWRDVISLGKGIGGSSQMFDVVLVISNNIGFWKFKWYGNHSFCELFPDLFAKEAFKDVMLSERMRGNGDGRLWSWRMRVRTSSIPVPDIGYLANRILSLFKMKYMEWKYI